MNKFKAVEEVEMMYLKRRKADEEIMCRKNQSLLLFDVFNYDTCMMRLNPMDKENASSFKTGVTMVKFNPKDKKNPSSFKTGVTTKSSLLSCKRKFGPLTNHKILSGHNVNCGTTNENVCPNVDIMSHPSAATTGKQISLSLRKPFSQVNGGTTNENVCPNVDIMSHPSAATPGKEIPLSLRKPFSQLNGQNVKENNIRCKKKSKVDKRSEQTPNSIFCDVFNSSQKELQSVESVERSKLCQNNAKALNFDMNAENEKYSHTIEDVEFSQFVEVEDHYSDIYEHDEDLKQTDSWSSQALRKPEKVPLEYGNLGPPKFKCTKCEASMWKEERVNKLITKGVPQFSLCCAKGEIKLPKEKPTPSYLWQLYNDEKKGSKFKESIRVYNSLFAFTSTGGRVDHSINCGGAPYIYRLNGINHHLFGSLIPEDGESPKFCQLYIYDTENEVSNRMKWINVEDGQTVHAEIVEGLMRMLDETNELVKEFRTCRDRFEEGQVTELEIILKVSRAESGRENHVATADDVAGIMAGDLDDNGKYRDIIIHSKQHGLQRISDIHPKLMALQYPLLFPHGDDGYHIQLRYGTSEKKSSRKRELLSQMEYYSYKLQVRQNEGMTPRLGGRLFQQYIVDAFSTIEQARLWWIRTHQTTLRNEVYRQLYDSLQSGNDDSSKVGKGIILPAGFVGSRRYMQQNFQDALAVCRYIGHPDIFLTMTTNPLWDEISEMMNLLPHCLRQNSPDIIARVFKLKLDQLVGDIKKNSYFGECEGVMYSVEFQKRGLPHVHMLIWLKGAAKQNLKNNVDNYVSAEIPNPEEDPAGYAAVKAFMIHGPCDGENPKSPCMKDFKCTRHFPKKYSATTTFDQSGFAIYRRRKTTFSVKNHGKELDSKWVVPYNRGLLVKYQCHINVEICCHARSIKYLFKYCLKGHDRATVEIRGRKKEQSDVTTDEPVDEIKQYFDGRYVCACEAAYRIFGFNIHHRTTSVQRLSFHLPGEKNCTFKAHEPLEKVVAREKHKCSQLEAFFALNVSDPEARKYTYDEIPQHYVWNDVDRIWNLRKRGFQVGRLFYTHHSTGELWYLRLLLTRVRGPTSFRSVRTVNGKVYPSFQEACKEFGLLDDDKEWDEVLQQCSSCAFAPQLRQLFVHIMVNCRVKDLKKLWEDHYENMIDDILLSQQKETGNEGLVLSDKQLEYYALAEIHKLLKSIGKSLKDYHQMPQPPNTYLYCSSNNLIFEETSYNIKEMETEFEGLISKCNEEQLKVYNSVMASIEKNEGGFFFIYGSGGCGKTYLWKTLISKLRSVSKIVLPVASSGIAATLMARGRTAHSRFKIPIILDDYSTCSIALQSDIAQLIRQTSLIIWDEAPMQHRYAFECLDRSLRDIMKDVDYNRFHMPFGGITVVLGGDFRQILPVIPRASRGEVVSA